jgi:hypothetical protein
MTRHPLHRAEDWLDEQTQPEDGGAKYLEGDPVPTRTELRAQQQREVGDPRGPVPLTTPAASDAQSKGMVAGGLLGAVVGLVLVTPIGLIEWADVSLGGRLLVAAIVGVAAGAAVGAVYAGGRMPELEGEARDADGSPQIGSTPRDPHTDARGR